MWVNVERYKDNLFPYQERLRFEYGINITSVITPLLNFTALFAATQFSIILMESTLCCVYINDHAQKPLK